MQTFDSSPADSFATVGEYVVSEFQATCEHATSNGVKYHSLPIGARTDNYCNGDLQLQSSYLADPFDGSLPDHISSTLDSVHERLFKIVDALRTGEVEEARQELYFAEDALLLFQHLVITLETHVRDTIAKFNADNERGCDARVAAGVEGLQRRSAGVQGA